MKNSQYVIGPLASVWIAKIEMNTKNSKKQTKHKRSDKQVFVLSFCFCSGDYYAGQSCKPIISPFERGSYTKLACK